MIYIKINFIITQIEYMKILAKWNTTIKIDKEYKKVLMCKANTIKHQYDDIYGYFENNC